jgi:hypothetical protein
MKVATAAREVVHGRIIAWLSAQTGTQQMLCKRLKISYTQLHALINDGVERCSLEYLLDVWERCGGTYSLDLNHSSLERGRDG